MESRRQRQEMDYDAQSFRTERGIANEVVRNLGELPSHPTPDLHQLGGFRRNHSSPSWSARHACGRRLLSNPRLDLLGQEAKSRIPRITQANRARKRGVGLGPAPNCDAVHAKLGF